MGRRALNDTFGRSGDDGVFHAPGARAHQARGQALATRAPRVWDSCSGQTAAKHVDRPTDTNASCPVVGCSVVQNLDKDEARWQQMDAGLKADDAKWDRYREEVAFVSSLLSQCLLKATSSLRGLPCGIAASPRRATSCYLSALLRTLCRASFAT